MNFYDDSKPAFNPPSLDFERDYSGAILVFDDLIWSDIAAGKILSATPAHSKSRRAFENFYECCIDETRFLLAYPNTGAPAATIDFELLIASGINNFVAFGTCGVFDPTISQNSIIIPTSAIREEGTSYHYLPGNDHLAVDQDIVEEMKSCAKGLGLPFTLGAIWTTDAVYRETENKIRMMRKRGCVGVEMEFSALLAVARFRKVDFMEFLIVDDLVLQNKERVMPIVRESRKYLQMAMGLLNKN